MINFRYHIVSLMAVFIALAVGIAVGVSLSPSVDEGILAQATQDRKQVADLRAELDRRNDLDSYRQTYEQRSGAVVLAGQLTDTRVAVVTMPGAPGAVTQAVSTAVQQAGAQVVDDVRVSEDVFDPTKTEQLTTTLSELTGPAELTDQMSVPTKLGRALSRSIAARAAGPRDVTAKRIGATLAAAGLANVREDVTDTAQLVIVISAPATDPVASDPVLAAHVQTEVALKGSEPEQVAVVVAGPDSDGIEGTDVLAVRTTSGADDTLSTVDVADLASGVVTTVLAGKEQISGGQGHYGALAKADSALPSLPVR